jgi:putative inorganic carbon (hco3(-)) transporter
MIDKVFHKSHFWIYFFSFTFILLSCLCIAFEIYYFPAIPVLMIFFLLAITSLDNFFLLTVFFVPLSIPLSYIIGKTGVDLSLPAEPFLIGILFLLILKYLKGQVMDKKILLHPVSIAVYFYLAWSCITCITSSMPVVSFKYLTARLWFIAGFYFLPVQIFQNKKYFKKYLWAYIIPLVAIIGYVLIRHSFYGLTNQQVSHYVVKPFYNDHTSYGAVLAMLIPVLIGIFYYNFRIYKNTQKIFFFLLILYFLIAILFSYTRAAWVSLFVIFAIWMLILLKIKWQFIFAGFMILLFILFSYRAEITLNLTRIKQTSSGNFHEHIQSVANIRNDDSNLERLNRWGCAWRMFRERPVFGWGPGTYMFNYAPFQISREKTTISTNAGTMGNAHSEYLGSLSESGILGVVSFLLIVILTIRTGCKVYYKTGKRKIRIFSLAVLLGLVTYYVHGFLNNFLDTDKVSALFWGFTAILVALDIYHSGIHERNQLPEN